jgi:DNA modification methylase
MTAASLRLIASSLKDDGESPWDKNAEAIHQWYRIIMGFDWKLADFIIEKLGVRPGHTVLDPFCGAGTTLVQCKKRGIETIGLDVNPVCTLATTVKTTWTLEPSALRRLLDRIVRLADSDAIRPTITNSAALRYLRASGMIERGWLSLHKAKIVLSIRTAIERTPMSPKSRAFFNLALISAVVSRIADVKFGPELYCLREARRLPAIASFVKVAEMMIGDMDYARSLGNSAISARVMLGDARSAEALTTAAPNGVDFAITSPPYPNEHDYTRSTRLELVVLDHVGDIAGLRRIKRDMVRCSTKGIYKDDTDAIHSANFASVNRVARNLDSQARGRSDGFSRLYGRMVREYFGGMTRHLQSVRQTLKPGGRCAYVVRDSCSLLGVYVDTPSILAKIARSPRVGFEIDEIIEWKKVRGTTGVKMLSEKIVFFRKPR